MSCHLTRLGIRPPQCVAHLAHPHPNECHPLPARHVLGDKLGQDHRGVQIQLLVVGQEEPHSDSLRRGHVRARLAGGRNALRDPLLFVVTHTGHAPE